MTKPEHDAAGNGVLAGITQHSLRQELTDELHARPFETLDSAVEVFLFAKLTGEGSDAEQYAWLKGFCQQFAVTPPPSTARHFSADFGTFRLRWERHTEFTSYTAFVPSTEPFAQQPPTALLDCLKENTGELLVATHLTLLIGHESSQDPQQFFASTSLVKSAILAGAATACTDLQIHHDGFNRILLINHAMGGRQAGRVVQHLLEIATYRNMALLSLPLSRALSPRIATIDQALSSLLTRMGEKKAADKTDTIEEDSALSQDLNRLAAENQQLVADCSYRFCATRAYYALVNNRIEELDEKPIDGYQTIGEFLARRLSPAMRTCDALANRLEDLALRTSQAGNVLRTRVSLALENQNHILLNSMDRRAKLQLRLQETVEGLSIAAITYYFVGLVGYATKGLKKIGLPLDPELSQGAAILPIALIVGLGVKKVRHAISIGEANRD